MITSLKRYGDTEEGKLQCKINLQSITIGTKEQKIDENDRKLKLSKNSKSIFWWYLTNSFIYFELLISYVHFFSIVFFHLMSEKQRLRHIQNRKGTPKGQDLGIPGTSFYAPLDPSLSETLGLIDVCDNLKVIWLIVRLLLSLPTLWDFWVTFHTVLQ